MVIHTLDLILFQLGCRCEVCTQSSHISLKSIRAQTHYIVLKIPSFLRKNLHSININKLTSLLVISSPRFTIVPKIIKKLLILSSRLHVEIDLLLSYYINCSSYTSYHQSSYPTLDTLCPSTYNNTATIYNEDFTYIFYTEYCSSGSSKR